MTQKNCANRGGFAQYERAVIVLKRRGARQCIDAGAATDKDVKNRALVRERAMLSIYSADYTNPSFCVLKFARFGKMFCKAESGTPIHDARVAPYWSTEVVGIQQPVPE